MTYLDRAIKDGYAIITGPENKQKIIYVTSDNHTENYNDPEEKVRAEFWAELIYEYDYPAHRIKVEVTIPDRVPTDRADIVIFSDDECKKPYAVCSATRFLRNRDRIVEKNSPILRSISEARSLASTAPQQGERPTQEGGLF